MEIYRNCMKQKLLEKNQIFLSTLRAGPRQRRFAGVVLALSLVVFLSIAPFAKTQLAQVWAFIPIYETSLIIFDLITAVLLFNQFHSYRSSALVVLANGYLFTAFMTIAHALTFPGLFAPTGLLGAGPQSTAWLYMIWHGGFPLFVIAYALLKDRTDATPPASVRTGRMLALSVAAVLVAVGGITIVVTQGHGLLPAIMQKNRHAPAMLVVVSTTWTLSLVALAVLWRRRPHSVLDLWLMVVLCAWLIDIALAAVLNGGRFDLGFYAGRIYGMLAASIVLLMLLVESGMLYAQLIQLTTKLQRLTAIDPLTEIANRRTLDSAMEQEWRRAMRTHIPLSLLLIDIDCFKQFNDTYGHVAGDHCLRRVAAALAGVARRAGDVAARYGGEEFAVVLPQTEAADAQQIAERVREAVLALSIPHQHSAAHPQVTVSIGVGSISFSGNPESPVSDQTVRANIVTLVEAADTALYAAKCAGRNQVSRGEDLVVGQLRTAA
jgi:diguanylate cyclase (GGDEF)-like protein